MGWFESLSDSNEHPDEAPITERWREPIERNAYDLQNFGRAKGLPLFGLFGPRDKGR